MRLPPRRVAIWHDDSLQGTFQAVAAGLRDAGIDVIHVPLPFDSASPASTWLADVGAILVSGRCPVSAALMDAAPNLAGVVCASIGTERVDVTHASHQGILVGHGATPENVVSMAEATVMLILMLCYQPMASMQVLQGERARPTPEERWARTLSGKTVGLVGLGRIGRAVAQRLTAFGCHVIASAHATLNPATVPPHVRVVPFDQLLAQSDIVSLHTSVQPGQPPILDAAALARMPAHARLVNTARGAALDEAALARALSAGRLAAAALDTFIVEPLPADSPLRQCPNVLLTPHLVGHTREMGASFQQAALDNLRRILEGQPPVYWKNPQASAAWQRRWAL